jgi:hypothetical protein
MDRYKLLGYDHNEQTDRWNLQQECNRKLTCYIYQRTYPENTVKSGSFYTDSVGAGLLAAAGVTFGGACITLDCKVKCKFFSVIFLDRGLTKEKY